jgi:hypothetical protein
VAIEYKPLEFPAAPALRRFSHMNLHGAAGCALPTSGEWVLVRMCSLESMPYPSNWSVFSV